MEQRLPGQGAQASPSFPRVRAEPIFSARGSARSGTELDQSSEESSLFLGRLELGRLFRTRRSSPDSSRNGGRALSRRFSSAVNSPKFSPNVLPADLAPLFSPGVGRYSSNFAAHSRLMDHRMPDTRRATVFDDLPESIITEEIFLRLPSKDVLRCGAVSRSWHGATTSKEFLLEHHSRQPSLPLIIFRHEIGKRTTAVDAFDIRHYPAERRPVLRFDDCIHHQTFRIEASCGGLLLLSLMNFVRFVIVNPATRRWLALPRLAGASGNIAGMYPHPHRSDEYRILFWRGKHEVRNAGFYILTVGSSEKPRYLGLPAASPCTKEVMQAAMDRCSWRPPVLLNGCLHWCRYYNSIHRVLVFDTLTESFRFMSPPNTARGARVLCELEGMLAMRCLDTEDAVVQIWVLHDYEREVWLLKCHIELPMVIGWRNTLMYGKRDTMVIHYEKPCLHQLHYDDNGKLLEEFQWETYYPDITGLWFKEKPLRHTFFPRRSGSRVRRTRFFRGL